MLLFSARGGRCRCGCNILMMGHDGGRIQGATGTGRRCPRHILKAGPIRMVRIRRIERIVLRMLVEHRMQHVMRVGIVTGMHAHGIREAGRGRSGSRLTQAEPDWQRHLRMANDGR